MEYFYQKDQNGTDRRIWHPGELEKKAGLFD